MTGKDEATVAAETLLAIGARPDVRLFRNTVGEGWQGRRVHLPGVAPRYVVLDSPRYVTFGLAPGSSDFVGWRTLEITPDLVGQRIAQLLAIETKRQGGGRLETAQRRFRDAVAAAGGLAAVIRDADSALACVESRGIHKWPE